MRKLTMLALCSALGLAALGGTPAVAEGAGDAAAPQGKVVKAGAAKGTLFGSYWVIGVYQ